MENVKVVSLVAFKTKGEAKDRIWLSIPLPTALEICFTQKLFPCSPIQEILFKMDFPGQADIVPSFKNSPRMEHLYAWV